MLGGGDGMTLATITPLEVDVLGRYIYGLCGILVDQSKAYLLESRLGPLLEEFQCHSYWELYTRAQHDASQHISQRIIDAISTKETSFFRDQTPFDLLKFKLLPDYFDRVRSTANGTVPYLSLWSAACSTGQEVYSISMTLKELPGDFGPYRSTILGTDISDTALVQASYGCYNKLEMARGLSPDRIIRYFQAVGSQWRVKDELRSLVSFRKLNLLESFAALRTFDIIFCRNVAIYFSQADRTQLFERLAKHLHPAGALLIGATESLQGITTRYIRKVYHNTVFYQLR
jgi:chemotaxis protein methyltransferase CheR